MENQLKSTEKISEYQPKRDLELFCYALVSEQCKGNKDAAERLNNYFGR